MRNNFAQNKQDFFGKKNELWDCGLRIADLNEGGLFLSAIFGF
jgi:hypothetical protein